MNGTERNQGDMNGHGRLTDDAIEAVFARRARRGEAGDLRDRVIEATAVLRQQRGPWATLRVGLRVGATDDRAGRRAMVLVLVLAALICLVLVSAIVGARLNDPRRGERLAFVRDGDIYLANGDGSEVTRLLHVDGTPFSDPAWSPDGSRLAVDSTTGAILVDVTTGAIQRIGGRSPAWSPDGGRLALFDDIPYSTSEVRILDPRTGATTTSASLSGIGPLVWSPNGRWIALTGTDPGALLRMDTSTGDVVQLEASFAHLDSLRDPSWSPDSARIAFVRYDGCSGSGPTCVEKVPSEQAYDVVVADADGSHAAELLTGPGSFDEPTWSPDGHWIAVRAIPGSSGRSEVSGGLIIARPDGSQQRVVTSANVETYAWNPTSDGLRFAVRAASPQPSALWEASLDGVAHPLPISVDATTFETSSGFAWHAPTANQQPPALASLAPVTPAPSLAIGTPPPTSPVDPSDVWHVLASESADGCVPVTVDTKTGTTTAVATLCDSTTPNISGFAWSPDASVYAAVMTDSANVGSLTLVRSNGTVMSNVAALRDISGVAWSPDGRWLAAFGDQSSRSPSYLLRPDGTLVRALPGTPSWTPDSRRLVVSAADGTLLIGGTNGSDLRSIGSFPAPSGWAPDGARFAFARDGDIWTAAADGTDVRNMTVFRLGGANSVAWSLDGQWMAVAPGRGLWLMRPDGTDRRFIDLGLAVGITDLAWSPNGHQLAVETSVDSGSGADSRVLLFEADGPAAIALESAGRPFWSPDGRFLAVSNTQGTYDVVDADGSGRAPLRGSPTANAAFVWIR